MEWTLILVVIGIAFAVLAIVAIRGSFRSDDAFYGESPPRPDEPTKVRDAGVAASDGRGDAPSDGDGGTDGD